MSGRLLRIEIEIEREKEIERRKIHEGLVTTETQNVLT